MSRESREQLIQNIWQKIELWYQSNASHLCNTLNKGVEVEQIKKIEAHIGFSLPEDYKASLMCHNGNIYVGNYEYMNIDSMLEVWLRMEELVRNGSFLDSETVYADEEIIKNTWWHIRWIPFAQDSGGNLLCLDTDPDKHGVFGQTIYWDVNEGPSPRKEKAFLEWLERYCDDLHEGIYHVDEDGDLVRN